jgi:hypothetical protein
MGRSNYVHDLPGKTSECYRVYSGFHETDFLLDNQADISIVRPGLLCAFKPAEKKVYMNGVGG